MNTFAVFFAIVILAWLAVITVILVQLLRRLAIIGSAARSNDLGGIVIKTEDDVKSLIQDVARLRTRQDDLRREMGQSIRGTGLVRFDAYDDMGGSMSFSIAFVDEDGDGIVITALNGRSDSRMYAKPVERGESIFRLSDEERRALDDALLRARSE